MIYGLFAEYFRYLLFSGLAAAANVLSRFLISQSGAVNYQLAVILAYIVGMVVNFFFNKKLNFPRGPRHFSKEMQSFIIIAVIGLAMVTLLATLFVSILKKNFNLASDIGEIETISHIIAVGITSIFNFFGHKYFTFRLGIRKGVVDLIKSTRLYGKKNCG
jgi:putative flippase GtrA